MTNIAHASATDPRNGDPVASGTSSVTVDATNDLSIVKSTNSTGYAAAGDTIDYGYELTDTGNSELTNVAVTDSLVGSVNCPSSTLAIGDSETCTGTYTVTQADVDAGQVYNNSYATALDSQSHVAHVGLVVGDRAGRLRHLDPERGQVDHVNRIRGGRGHHPLQVRGQEHRDNHRVEHRGDRQQGGHGQLSGRIPRSRGLQDMHRYLHGDPGRRGRRLGDQLGRGEPGPIRNRLRSPPSPRR